MQNSNDTIDTYKDIVIGFPKKKKNNVEKIISITEIIYHEDA